MISQMTSVATPYGSPAGPTTEAVGHFLDADRLAAARDPIEVTRALEAGLPGHSLRALRRVGFTIEELAAVTGTSPRTLVRYAGKPSGKLPLPLSDRLVRLARVTLLATHLLGPIEDVLTWMRSRTRALGDVTPLLLLKTDDGTQAVVQSLYTIAYGGVA